MDYEDDEQNSRKNPPSNRIIYSLPCRLGLWQNEEEIRQSKCKAIENKRDNCQMLVQLTKKMVRNMLKPVGLEVEEACMFYGKNYMIKSSGFNNVKYVDCSKGLYLTGLITEKELPTCQHFRHGCGLSASPMEESFTRNSFALIKYSSYPGNKVGDPVYYGEDIMIKISKSQVPLYVQCENHTIDTFGSHLSLRLTSIPDVYCKFKVFHWNPQKRQEFLGTTFTPRTKVVIQHTASGQNLAVETLSWMPTFFGPECNVSCHTYLDSHKMETDENFWMFKNAHRVQVLNRMFHMAAQEEETNNNSTL
ncbi:unnamed protein product [Ceutorhynchus assimilis]|uniref:Uncharacterized protein n=1 Tax=Ceutorhynchus assimilis TaxID=467358 RepID=A0A9N9MN08_9CUCU|nr:unnamed protein product [Ceutorhynchus assimilis]